MGVEDNPSTTLVNQLKTCLPEACCEVLETSGTGSLERLVILVEENRCSDIVVHFGVDSTSDCFKIEKCAYNEADFRCADERGWKPTKQTIDPSKPLGVKTHTLVDVDALVRELSLKGFPVRVSTDPGRFVCNWIFYHSLCSVNQKSVFVHIPVFAVIDLETQLSFALTLIDLLGTL